MWLVLSLLGCPKSTPLPAVDWEAPPRLPAPAAGTYSRVTGVPPDPGVVEVLAGRAWDASLGGAASGLALQLVEAGGGLSAPEVREAAWRAGWPYPVSAVQVWKGPAGQPPPEAVAAWVLAQPRTSDLALVRARTGPTDLWLGVTATPRADLGLLPRQLPVGSTLVLPAVPSAPTARFVVSDPMGGLREGHLEAAWTETVDLQGEWLVDIRDERGPIATFPVYVGMVPPSLSLLIPGDPPRDDAEAATQARARLTEVRDAYGLPPYDSDVLLDAAARTTAQDPSVPVASLATRVGIDPAGLWRWECRSSTVEGCLDAVVWDPRSRPGLLTERALMGVVAEGGAQGVHLVLLIARDD